MSLRILFLWIGLTIFSSALDAASPAENLTKNEDSWFHSDAGRAALDCILSWQSVHGDWPKNKDTTVKKYTGKRSELKGTFDNGATLGELRALARAFGSTGEERYRTALLLGFDHILNAQYSNGGWPQYFPLRDSYHRHITFNDGAMIRVMEFLRDSATARDFAFLDGDRRAAATDAVQRGVDCILKCQIIVDGRPTVWCAQHDEVTLAPAQGRAYELVSLSGAESAGILKFLMSIEKPSPDAVAAVKAGMAWFESARIEGFRYVKSGNQTNLIADPTARPLWARFYEIETNRPIFCGRDGVVKYNVEEIEAERRGGYSWYGNWGENIASLYSQWSHR